MMTRALRTPSESNTVATTKSNSKLATAQVAELKAKTEALDRSQAVIEFDLNGNILHANQNFLQVMGYSLEEIVGRHHSLFIDAAYANSDEYRQLWADLKSGHFRTGEFKRFGKGGKEVWIQASYNPVLDSSGTPYKVIKFATDVTETKVRCADSQGQIDAISKSQAVIEFDLNGNVISANENFLGLLGYTLPEIVGKHHSTFVDTTFASSFEYRQFWDSLRSGEHHTGEFKRIGRGGKEVWIHASYNPIFDLNGKPCKVVKYASDVTGLKFKTADFEGQLSAINKSQAVIEFDLQGNILNANENFLSTLGYSLDEVKGKHHSLFVEPEYSASAQYRQFWDDLRAGKYQASEYKRIGKGGKEVWIQASYNPIFDLNGKPFKVVKYATDVTDSKLRNADFQGQLQAINKALAVIEFDLSGTIKYANENFLQTMGYSLDEIQGKHHSMFAESSFAGSQDYRNFWENLRAGRFEQGMYKRVAKGGKIVWLQASYNPILDLNGKPCKVVKYASDITASKEMEFAIAERQKQDEQDARILNTKVNEILEVVAKVAKRDYSQTLSVFGEDAVGQLGEGLSRFFKEKQETEMVEQARLERERAVAEETSRKVAVVLETVNSVASGNFRVKTPDLGTDAVGQVGSALNRAVHAIDQALQQVRDVSVTVSSAAEQLTSASQEISSGAQTQASSLEETASSLEEITSTVKQNTDNAQQARQLAVSSRDVAEKGGEVVGQAVQAMGEINQASKKIADIITTIDEIAFQTNLLALNAAVEAARAGEQGRGFAVVASEVRNLAQRSATAAKEIKSLIQDSVRKVEVGTELVNKSGASLNDIVNSVKRVTDIVAEIAAASKEQLTGIEQVNKAVSQMDRVTQSNAAQTEEMSGTADSLLGNATQLSQLVERFKLRSSRRSAKDRNGKRKLKSASNLKASAQQSISKAVSKPLPLKLDTSLTNSSSPVFEF